MFLNNKEKKQGERNWLSLPIAIFISLMLIFLSKLSWLNTFSNATSYILDPIYTASSQTANRIKGFFTTLTQISEFREEYNGMKLKIAEYEISNIEYQKLRKENIDLKEQLELGNKDNKYLEAEVLDRIEADYLIINLGSENNIKNGDIVVLGEYFVGIVIDVNVSTSKVRLPISKSNFLEAYVISSKDESNQKILSRAIVNGSSDGIRIENIGMNSGVENGDIVIVNDTKVGENLILGTVVGLSEDPAKTTRNGYVSPVIDYYDLVNIFVKIDNAN